MWAEAVNRAASAAATVDLPLPGMPLSRTAPAAGAVSTGTSSHVIVRTPSPGRPARPCR